MLRGLFVTGTDTGVGKTVVCAALLHRYRRETGVRYWKPIQTGVEVDDDTAAVRDLAGGDPAAVLDCGVRLEQPVSPHLAARLAGTALDVGDVASIVQGAAGETPWIVEGAGGVLVPVSEERRMVDLIRALGLPALVVARSTLGTINHTLLTLEALRRRDVRVSGVVMVGPLDPENRTAIETFGDVPVVAELPQLAPLSGAALAAWARQSLDPRGVLSECFR